MDTILSNFSERLQELMEERELNPREIGEDTEHNLYDFYHWKPKQIKYMPKLAVLIDLADYFHCSLTFLLGMEEENTLPNPRKNLPVFSERFAWVMKKSGKTYTHVAKAANLSGTSILYKWKKGVSTPRVYTLVSVAEALDCSLDYLIGREN